MSTEEAAFNLEEQWNIFETWRLALQRSLDELSLQVPSRPPRSFEQNLLEQLVRQLMEVDSEQADNPMLQSLGERLKGLEVQLKASEPKILKLIQEGESIEAQNVQQWLQVAARHLTIESELNCIEENILALTLETSSELEKVLNQFNNLNHKFDKLAKQVETLKLEVIEALRIEQRQALQQVRMNLNRFQENAETAPSDFMKSIHPDLYPLLELPLPLSPLLLPYFYPTDSMLDYRFSELSFEEFVTLRAEMVFFIFNPT